VDLSVEKVGKMKKIDAATIEILA